MTGYVDGSAVRVDTGEKLGHAGTDEASHHVV
eukprot:CAMPEP_0178466454 /NCGR_PEP_ID=MMETSP0689_2-20121128/51910_1 /TAXON_ID=160604 /ORGANISM="Amphidinium massartii, Strain CS-259" /LENGTH=31 /DNA_ID= /DNA_START= /DNA_END= /DNA_ORIENTATION=